MVKNKLDIIFANEEEITSLIEAKNFNEVIEFGKQIKKLLIITRGSNGAISINDNKVCEVNVKNDLKIVDLTGAGDLFAAGYLHGYLNNFRDAEGYMTDTLSASWTNNACHAFEQRSAEMSRSTHKLHYKVTEVSLLKLFSRWTLVEFAKYKSDVEI